MKKVVLLGDSIRMIGYGPLVPEILGEGFSVWQPDDNCRFAKYTLRLIFEEFDSLKDADIIYWNNGLWDCTHLFDDGFFTEYEEYERNILRIAKLLKRITPNVIFATTTPVNWKNAYNSNLEIKSFNDRIVSKLMALGIKIHDLYSIVYPKIDSYIKKDDLIHLTEEGSLAVAKEVASTIKSEAKIEKGIAKHEYFIKNKDVETFPK